MNISGDPTLNESNVRPPGNIELPQTCVISKTDTETYTTPNTKNITNDQTLEDSKKHRLGKSRNASDASHLESWHLKHTRT